MKKLTFILIFITAFSYSQNYNFTKCLFYNPEKDVDESFDCNTSLIINLPDILIYRDGSSFKFKIISEAVECNTMYDEEVFICFDMAEVKTSSVFEVKINDDGTKLSLVDPDGNLSVYYN